MGFLSLKTSSNSNQKILFFVFFISLKIVQQSLNCLQNATWKQDRGRGRLGIKWKAITSLCTQYIHVLHLSNYMQMLTVCGVLIHSLDSVSAVAHVPGSLHELFNRSPLQEGSRQRGVRRGVGWVCTLTAMVDKHKLGWVAHSYTTQDDFNGSRETRWGI